MIKLSRPDKPAELVKNEEILLKKYINAPKDKKPPVWRKDYIVNELSKMTHGKCAYCENFVRSLEVEHFFCRHKHENKVVEWENLLPICHDCNKNKSNHDCDAEPIINPTIDNPKDYLGYRGGRFYSKNGNMKGKCTITYLKWDVTDYFWKIHADIYDTINAYIDGCLEK